MRTLHLTLEAKPIIGRTEAVCGQRPSVICNRPGDQLTIALYVKALSELPNSVQVLRFQTDYRFSHSM